MTKDFSKSLLCAVCFSAFGFAGSVSAASITYTLSTDVSLGGANKDFDETIQNSFVPLDGNETVSVSSDAKDDFGPGQGSATAGFDIDKETGAIKFGAASSVTAPSSPIVSNADGSLSLNLIEDFNIVGTGNITFRLGLEGVMSTSTTRNDGGEGARVQAAMRLVDTSSGFNVLGSDNFAETAGVNTTSIIDEVLEFTANISESKTYLFTLSLSSGVDVTERGLGNAGQGASDFLNTAFLSFSADPTLSVTPSDPLFLSDAGGGGVPAIPLPAGAWLLLGGVGCLRLLRRNPRNA